MTGKPVNASGESAAAAPPTTDRVVDALLAAVDDDGHVERDGLHVERTDDGYAFESPTVHRPALDEAALRQTARANEAIVRNWYHWDVTLADRSADRRAFLRWAEGADPVEDSEFRERRAALRDGVSNEWGQVAVSVRLHDGARVYDLRHVDDADHDAADLAHHDDPRALRELVKYDSKGRYRPLKTAPSLQTGWVLAGVDHGTLLDAMDVVYPATVANWYRELTGDLDVSHWHDTAERQTGIYGIVEELDHETVDDVAAACCADSQCLKRREWQFDDETDLAADGGAGVFPCREPCSLVVAAARKWTTLEREEPRTYEFDLTPSEKEQLEAIVDAVADGRVDDVREADVYEGANRYRVRYLREKLFDEDGNLCGVPTDPDGDGDEH